MKPFKRDTPKRSKAALRWQEMGRESLEVGPPPEAPRAWLEVFAAEQRAHPPVRRRYVYAIPRADW